MGRIYGPLLFASAFFLKRTYPPSKLCECSIRCLAWAVPPSTAQRLCSEPPARNSFGDWLYTPSLKELREGDTVRKRLAVRGGTKSILIFQPSELCFWQGCSDQKRSVQSGHEHSSTDPHQKHSSEELRKQAIAEKNIYPIEPLRYRPH
jgi:hypothetical protein